jgi:cysteine desulfurase
MHVNNNEIGTVLDLERVARICQEHGALFHSDTVQSIGKMKLNLEEIPIDFIVASAHKFHGPKGVGFAFVRKIQVYNRCFMVESRKKACGQELRRYIKLGMVKALAVAYDNLDQEEAYIVEIKTI